MRLAGATAAERRARVTDAARILQLEDCLDRKPRDLSGGQRQRVELRRLHQALEANMIYVTHDQVEAMTMADQIVVLRAGYVEQTGSPMQLYHQPDNLFVAGFIGPRR